MPIPLAIPLAVAGAGALSSMYDSFNNKTSARDAYNKISGLADDAVTANQADIDAYSSLVEKTYGNGARNYSDAVQAFLDSPVYQNEGFSYQGDINQFLDPMLNQRVDAAMQAINNSSASNGNRFSSDYLSALSAKNQALAGEAWESAYQKLMQDRQQQLSEWQANSGNAWNNYNAQQGQLKNAVDIYGNDRNSYVQGLGDATMASMNNRLGGLQTQASVIGGKANSQQGPGVLSQLLGPTAQFMGSYYGAQA